MFVRRANAKVSGYEIELLYESVRQRHRDIKPEKRSNKTMISKYAAIAEPIKCVLF